MNVQLVGLAAALSLIPGMATAEVGDSPWRPVLVVRTYSNGTVARPDLRTARDFAESIFTDAGITVSWVDCDDTLQKPVDGVVRCNQPIGTAVVLQIRRNGLVDGNRYSSLGYSLVGRQTDGAPPVFSTVFADRVASTARSASVDARRLLGYAIAHEIGHLLLDDPCHPDAGLMRATWSRIELQRNRTTDWRFARAEAEVMRSAVTARTAHP
jgi:hypothetical protein